MAFLKDKLTGEVHEVLWFLEGELLDLDKDGHMIVCGGDGSCAPTGNHIDLEGLGWERIDVLKIGV